MSSHPRHHIATRYWGTRFFREPHSHPASDNESMPSLESLSDDPPDSSSTSAVENHDGEDGSSFGQDSQVGGFEGLSYEETYEGSRRYFVVGRGRNPGIYLTWFDTRAGPGALRQLDGVRGATYVTVYSVADAYAVWDDCLKSGSVASIRNPLIGPLPAPQPPPLLPKERGRFIAIYRGRHIGVFNNWAGCAHYVINVEGAKYDFCDSFHEALCAFKYCIESRYVCLL
ncbi:hypothetical protein NLI96_g11871 [Meripilus lineatus]|uniref:Ribonuclease H1 N-terminal domain-containing protein n=1 Tax=Meripilus lineatus TaxID=2056292 RepID=A0AAD5USE4_9APHY|nr:hypothetical protein NLI96_g11871 [Physisporinus lineatus]